MPGYTLHSQVKRLNNQSVALFAADAAPVPLLTPAPMPVKDPVIGVAAGRALSDTATLELRAPL